MSITLTIRSGSAQQTLAVLQGHLSNLAAPLTATKEIALDSIRQTFAAGGRPDAWVPLRSPRRRGNIGSAVPLNDSGVLRASITGTVTPTSLILGTNVRYAAIHQFGGTVHIPAITAKPGHALRWYGADGSPIFRRSVRAHSVTIPARPFMVLQDQDIKAIVQVFEEYLSQGATE